MRRIRCGHIAALWGVLILAVSFLCGAEETLWLDAGWKFATGDDPSYAQPGFDDGAWSAIRVDRIWEEQGYAKLDGYAWFRLKVTIPAGLRDRAHLRDGLRIALGKINNFDQTYLNGQLIGVNGKTVPAGTAADDAYIKAAAGLWDAERVYTLAPDDPRIRWGEDNVLAVRVYDEGGQGGLWSGGQNLRMMRLGDYLACDSAARPFVFRDRDLEKTFRLTNTSSRHTLEGRLQITARRKLDDRPLLERNHPVTLAPGASRQFSVTLPAPDGACRLEYAFHFEGTGEVEARQEETPYILTPAAPLSPRLNGPAVYGARPRRPFLFAVAASGRRPMSFKAEGLPRGLVLDSRSGIISGIAPEAGEYVVVLSARNDLGTTRRSLRLTVGERIALTPPMGWNSWNCWGLSVDQEKVLASARSFVAKGLRDYGWSYVNIDDGWEIKGDAEARKRDNRGALLANEKFPDMKALGDGIHALGLKLGIYSSPGFWTCGGYAASWGGEEQDACAWADWGIDYLKYDWCSYEKIARDASRDELMKPYRVMRRALDRVDRDIVFSLCQYGMGNVWEWGNEVGGNLWRTTEDITDTWESMSNIGFSQVKNAPFAGPGRWNDPDMLVVGWVGWGPSLHPTRLTPDEQYTHISLWSLLSAPLLIGCDLEHLDPFTLSLLENDEVLAVDQDPLGKPAVPLLTRGEVQIWVKEMADGTRALGLFNLGAGTARFRLPLTDIGLDGKVKLRDLWRQKNLGSFSGTFPAAVPAHGVVLLKAVK
jgi:alpha-galactosidase